jgi:hypothetical protein
MTQSIPVQVHFNDQCIDCTSSGTVELRHADKHSTTGTDDHGQTTLSSQVSSFLTACHHVATLPTACSNTIPIVDCSLVSNSISVSSHWNDWVIQDNPPETVSCLLCSNIAILVIFLVILILVLVGGICVGSGNCVSWSTLEPEEPVSVCGLAIPTSKIWKNYQAGAISD